MILAIFSCLFIFLGMFIGNKLNLKRLSICGIFGLFAINSLQCISSCVYNFLYRNYHNTTYFYIVLGVILGYLLLKLINCKYEDCDNISIFGFTVVNTFLLIIHRFSFLFLLINIIYYILLGIYIRKSKSWIYVLTACLLSIILSFIKIWTIGYFYGINIGFILYFILSVYSMIFRSNDKKSIVALIIGISIALLGGLL